MADVGRIISEIIDGLVDNCKVNRMALDEGWDADLAISIYYTDAELGNNEALMAKYGEPDDGEMAHIRDRIGKFLTVNAGWYVDDDGEPIRPLVRLTPPARCNY